MFLYIDPIKQGLKREYPQELIEKYKDVFIHRSNKTRIETLFLEFYQKVMK